MGTEQLGLGRKPEIDYRDQRFLAAERLTTDEQPITGRKFWWDNGFWEDQGQTGRCTGYATPAWIEDSKITHPGVDFDPVKIYEQIVLRDQWPENDSGDPNFGSSGHACARWLRDMGIISEWSNALSLNTVARWLLYRGTILAGTIWTNSMFDLVKKKDALGDLRPFIEIRDDEGGFDQGHMYLWTGINVERQTIRVTLPSWPRDSFGVNGRAVISFETAERLIWMDAEMICADEILGKAETITEDEGLVIL